MQNVIVMVIVMVAGAGLGWQAYRFLRPKPGGEACGGNWCDVGEGKKAERSGAGAERNGAGEVAGAGRGGGIANQPRPMIGGLRIMAHGAVGHLALGEGLAANSAAELAPLRAWMQPSLPLFMMHNSDPNHPLPDSILSPTNAGFCHIV